MTCHRRAFLAASLGMVLTSCAQLAPRQPAAGPLVIEVREDSSQRFITFTGPKAQHAPRFLKIPETNFYCLRSFIDRRTGETAHQLYVTDSYSGAERGWNAARDSTGAALPFVPIGRNEISCDAGCSYAEEFAANLPESALRTSLDGLAVTFSSSCKKRGTRGADPGTCRIMPGNDGAGELRVAGRPGMMRSQGFRTGKTEHNQYNERPGRDDDPPSPEMPIDTLRRGFALAVFRHAITLSVTLQQVGPPRLGDRRLAAWQPCCPHRHEAGTIYELDPVDAPTPTHAGISLPKSKHIMRACSGVAATEAGRPEDTDAPPASLPVPCRALRLPVERISKYLIKWLYRRSRRRS